MTRIGSWWLASHESQEGEKVLWSCLANRTQSGNRAVGGKLFLTNQRLLFSPHLFNCVLGGKKWSVKLSEISKINRQSRGGDAFGGGLRDRLRVTLYNGNIELFVVNHPDQVIERLRAELKA